MMLTMRNRLNRLFIVLFVAWCAYCLFLYPIQLAGQAFTHRDNHRALCYDLLNSGAVSRIEPCLAEADKEFQAGTYSGFGFTWKEGEFWSYAGYYRGMSWLLITMILIPPIMVYLLCWGIAAVSLWVWRGQQSGVV
jgi:hypothetical protein